MNEKHKLQIGIMGSWRGDLPRQSYTLAEEIGHEIAKSDSILLTGGSTGIMEHAMKGCKEGVESPSVSLLQVIIENMST